jgi:hypothetical protein
MITFTQTEIHLGFIIGIFRIDIKSPGILKHIKSSWAFCGISLKKLYMTLGEMEKFLSIFGLFFGEYFQ